MGRQRVEPGPGQESVWDYLRLEMGHPPVYYVVGPFKGGPGTWGW